MGVHEAIAVWIDREPRLDEDIAAPAEDDIFEMANLVEDQTGVPGVIFISTASHSPMVFRSRPRVSGRNSRATTAATAVKPTEYHRPK